MDGHVVGVHHAVDKADSHPVCDHRRRGFGHFGEPSDDAVIGAHIVVREVVTHGVVNQGSKGLMLSVGHVDLETPEADETRSDSAHDRPRFGCGITVVEDISNNLLAGCDQREGSRGGHAKVVHRLAAEEFSN